MNTLNMRRKQTGLTLLELLATLVISAVLTLVAVPQMGALVKNNRAVAQSNEVLGAIRSARSEAVNRGVPVSVCAAASAGALQCATTPGANWNHGWLMFVDNSGTLGSIDAGDTLLREYPALNSAVTLAANRTHLSFESTGMLASSAATLQLRVDQCQNDSNRNILVARGGRAYVQHTSC